MKVNFEMLLVLVLFAFLSTAIVVVTFEGFENLKKNLKKFLIINAFSIACMWGMTYGMFVSFAQSKAEKQEIIIEDFNIQRDTVTIRGTQNVVTDYIKILYEFDGQNYGIWVTPDEIHKAYKNQIVIEHYAYKIPIFLCFGEKEVDNKHIVKNIYVTPKVYEDCYLDLTQNKNVSVLEAK